MIHKNRSKYNFLWIVSRIPNIRWSRVLSTEKGPVTTCRIGDNEHPLRERTDMIDEVNESEVECLIEEAIYDPEKYDWLDLELKTRYPVLKPALHAGKLCSGSPS